MPRRLPHWARPGDAPPTIVDDAGAANKKMLTDLARDRLHTRGTAHLPLDRERAQRELTEGERALRDSRPRTRRWKALDKLDSEVDRARQRQHEATERLHDAEQALVRAPADDARSLADWLARGERGERPDPTLYERERERDAARLLVEAATVEVDRALERRFQHIQSKREKMLEDALGDVESARERLLAQVRALPGFRQTLAAARETLLWIAAYPDQAPSFGFPTATALGLQEPVQRTLQTSARIEYAALLQALEADVTAPAEAFSNDQKHQLGIVEAKTPLREALWDSDEDNIRWKKSELERARRLGEWQDPHQLAAEIRDMRP